MDEMVYQTQRWLNKTYGNDSRYNKVEENGRTGWGTIYGLTRALQIELGIENTADNFGPTSQRLYGQSVLKRKDGQKSNKYGILQGALWCKGYSTGHYYADDNGFSTVFDKSVESAVKELKGDAGILNPDGVVTTNFMSALLSMDSFKLLSSYGGDSNIREFQQEMNRQYESYIGIMPCDGVYGRNTNDALIYAIQAEEGLPIDVANGNFGSTTKRCCPTIPYQEAETDYYGNVYTTSQIERFTKLLKFGLYANGFGNGTFNGSLSQTTLVDFQSHHAIPQTGIADLTTWLSVMISSGDTDRSAKACDCATILTPAKATTLKSRGYEVVGRYLTGTVVGGASKALSRNEIKIIFDAGLRFFPIYQAGGYYYNYFTVEQGIEDGLLAEQAALKLGLPRNTILYFAVDFDAMDYQIEDSIIPYFKAVNASLGKYYQVGIYGARNICSKVAKAGYSVSSFVGDMSTGFSGNLGFKIPDDWAFDQFDTVTVGSGDGEIEIDKDGYSGRDKGVSFIENDDNPNENYPGENDASKPAPGGTVTGGSGQGLAQVNMSGRDMQVFAGRRWTEKPGAWLPVGNPIGMIPSGGFFVYKETHPVKDNLEETNSQRLNKVVFTNAKGQRTEGFVYTGGNAKEGDTEYADIWNSKEDFMNYTCDAVNNKLVRATAENILGAMCTVYTLAAPTNAFDSNGDFVETIEAETKVGLASNICGNSFPHLIYIDRIFNKDKNKWEEFDRFINLRFDLGNMPNNRLLR